MRRQLAGYFISVRAGNGFPPAGNRSGWHNRNMFVKAAFVLLACSAGAPAQKADWNLVWHDEFDGSKLDPSKWAYVTGGDGFGNQELEYYTGRPRNIYIEHGMLVIQALKENYRGPDGGMHGFTSARLQTRGKFARAYGKFEARIKIPCGQGTWPAFWMMGDVSAGWPASGEIDIMENIGGEPATVHGTVHGPGYSGEHAIGAPFSLPEGQRFCDEFHVLAVEWEPEGIRLYVDGKQYQSLGPASLPEGAKWVFDRPFYLILNLAVGGEWPGSPGGTSRFPQKMLVDYVRVYRR